MVYVGFASSSVGCPFGLDFMFSTMSLNSFIFAVNVLFKSMSTWCSCWSNVCCSSSSFYSICGSVISLLFGLKFSQVSLICSMSGTVMSLLFGLKLSQVFFKLFAKSVVCCTTDCIVSIVFDTFAIVLVIPLIVCDTSATFFSVVSCVSSAICLALFAMVNAFAVTSVAPFSMFHNVFGSKSSLMSFISLIL